MIENLIFPLDYIILTMGGIVILFSFWKGIISSILGLLTWIGSILITLYFYDNLSNFINTQLLKLNLLNSYEQITNILSTIISIPLIFLISLFVLKRFRKIISSDLDRQILGLFIDKFFGFLFGFVLNYIILSTLIYCSDNFEFLNFLKDWLIENSHIMIELDIFNNNLFISIVGNEEITSN
ncbi:MAG: CvpA family protein [Pelagibacteraceae bacterium]|nr:CvpA family protein [Pelagibacteraceae bacterium]